MLLRPSDKAIDLFKRKLTVLFSSMSNLTVKEVIQKLNPILRGWANAFRFGYSSEPFSKLDRMIWKLFFTWCKKKYPRMATREIISKFFKDDGKGLQPFYLNAKDEPIFLARLNNAVTGVYYGPIRGGKFKGQYAGRKPK